MISRIPDNAIAIKFKQLFSKTVAKQWYQVLNFLACIHQIMKIPACLFVIC